MPDGVKCYQYDPINGWVDYSEHMVAISPDRKAITLEYKDGDFGDLDGVANKYVVDPVGFGVAAAGEHVDAAAERRLAAAHRPAGTLVDPWTMDPTAS